MSRTIQRICSPGTTPDALARCATGARVQPAVLRILADGRPAPVDEIAADLGVTPRQAEIMLRLAFPEAERDAEGAVVGLGLSLTPTPHEVRLDGRDHVLYAWCAPDALLLPATLGSDATVTSPSHATGNPVRVRVGPSGVQEVDPETAVVSFASNKDPKNLRATGCVHQNFFAYPEEAESWSSKHPGLVAVPVAEAFDLLVALRDRRAPPSAGQRSDGEVAPHA